VIVDGSRIILLIPETAPDIVDELLASVLNVRAKALPSGRRSSGRKPLQAECGEVTSDIKQHVRLRQFDG
jgi:hypothetical protein